MNTNPKIKEFADKLGTTEALAKFILTELEKTDQKCDFFRKNTKKDLTHLD